MKQRASGILLHISSLPSRHGIGDFGPSAYEFVDLLAQTKQSYWQILPLNPTETCFDNSPYRSRSAFALNPLFISIDYLIEEGLLEKAETEPAPEFCTYKVDYSLVSSFKMRCLRKAFDRFSQTSNHNEYIKYCSQNSGWLDDYALFVSLKSKFDNKVWIDWPIELIERDPQALSKMTQELKETIEMHRFLQCTAERQWISLKRYANERGVHIIGDIPIYIDHDSADVWANQEIFKLDENRKPRAVSGVPPDYFSETGQLWGNPVYRWDEMKKNGFAWWRDRTTRNLHLFDIARVDHFRGLIAYWEIPAGAENAIGGEWVTVPTVDFLNGLLKIHPFLPVIAEDLGIITPDVREIISKYNLPGMNVLLFAFDSDTATNPHIPHNVAENRVLYTGTHDNNTARGWYENEASAETKNRLFEYFGREVTGDNISRELIRLAMMCNVRTAIISMQDYLGLGSEARMNIPSTCDGNWRWRLSKEQLQNLDTKGITRLTEIYGRA